MYSHSFPLSLVFSFQLERPGVIGLSRSTAADELRVLLESFEQYPTLKLSCYFDGFLLDSLRQSERDILDSLAALVRAKRLELLAGFYYEPELSLASQDDLTLQLDYAAQVWSNYNLATPTGLRVKDFVSADVLNLAEQAGFSYLLAAAKAFPEEPTNHGLIEFRRVAESNLTLLSEVRHLAPCRADALYEDLQKEARSRSRNDVLIPASLTSRLGIGRYSGEQEGPLMHFEQLLTLLRENKDFELLLLSEALSLDTSDSPSISRLRPLTPGEEPSEYTIRAQDIRRQLSRLPEYIETRARLYANQERMAAAIRLHQQSLHRPPGSNLTPHEKEGVKRSAVGSLIAAQVEIDAVYHAEVDPSEGWVERNVIDFDQDGEAEEIIDTPFARYCFKPSEGGRLMSFEYKPRRINLTGNLGAELPSFTAALSSEVSPESSAFAAFPAKASRPRGNPGMLVERIIEPLSLPGSELKLELYKDFLFHAGVGAHLNQATTGFNLEYWLETDLELPAELALVLDTSLTLPSLSAEVLSARALLCVGGSSEKAFSLQQTQTLDISHAPGGLYGVRLIDGVKNFVIDLRSSRQLSRALLTPVISEGVCIAISVRLAIPARLVQGDHSFNTLFLSIA